MNLTYRGLLIEWERLFEGRGTIWEDMVTFNNIYLGNFKFHKKDFKISKFHSPVHDSLRRGFWLFNVSRLF